MILLDNINSYKDLKLYLFLLGPLHLKPGEWKKKIFENIIKESFECEVISWTIPNVTYLLIEPYNAVQSPLFSYKGITWSLKISCCDMPGFPTDCCEIVLECLQDDCRMVGHRMKSPKALVYNFFCRIFFKGQGGKESDDVKDSIVFNTNHGERSKSRNVRRNYVIPFRNIYKKYRHNDTMTLVCELYNKNTSLTEMDFKSKSSDLTLGEYYFFFSFADMFLLIYVISRKYMTYPNIQR